MNVVYQLLRKTVRYNIPRHRAPSVYLGLVMCASFESRVWRALIFCSVSLRTTCRGCVFTTLRVAGRACTAWFHLLPAATGRFIMCRLMRPLAADSASTMAFVGHGGFGLGLG